MFKAGIWLGVVDSDGKLIVHYPESEGQLGIEEHSHLKECMREKSSMEADGYIYSPLVIGDTCLGSLIGKSDERQTHSLGQLLKSLNVLFVSQINNKIEKKGILRETLDTYKEINLLYNIGDSISSCLDVAELARTILHESSKIIKSECSSLMLLDSVSGRLEIKSAFESKDTHRMDLSLGNGIAGIVAQDAKYIISNDVSQDPRFIPGGNNIRSLLCVPLKTRQKVLGVINVRNKRHGEMFTARDAKLLSALASQAAIFIENAILHERKLNEDRLRRNLERYLSPHIAKNLMENSQELKLGGVKKKVAILFADIRKFTSLSEEMDPGALVAFLNDFFTRMVDVIFKYGGTVDKFVGDEIMAIFGAPITKVDDEIRVVKTAIEMQLEMQKLQSYWQKKNLPALSIGIGINSGEVIAGNIGCKRHMDYTVIGDMVNIAKRLETQATGGKILISRNIQKVNSKLYKFKDVGEIFVKGKKKPVETFEVIY